MGFGNMGKTYANSFISSRFIKPEDIHVLVRDASKIQPENGIPSQNISSIPTAKISDFDIVILAVKHQYLKQLAISIKPFIKENQLILSVMAGVTIATIQSELNYLKVTIHA